MWKLLDGEKQPDSSAGGINWVFSCHGQLPTVCVAGSHFVADSHTLGLVNGDMDASVM